MCGIAGIFHQENEKKVSEDILQVMANSISHRGPDDVGFWTRDNIGLAHRRLSILDLSERGHQPFKSSDNRFFITYNGEIYNFEQFRHELLQKGYNFISASDTEVLLYLYAEYGHSMLHRLNGMFAFAIWDDIKKELFLCRDRIGVKPLYYSHQGNSLYFASEPKALFTAGIPLEIDESRWQEFLLYRFISGDGTLYKNVQKLLPGHYAIITSKGIRLHRWWNLAEQVQKHEAIKDPLGWFDETFQDAVRHRMVSDVPVGVLLSGGLDSSSVLASLHRQHYQVSTFNIGFESNWHDESTLAKNLAISFGYPFFTTRLEGEQLYQTVIDSTWYNDEPLVHYNDPHLLTIAHMAKPHVSVLLSGEGSDELMAGYVRYRTWRYASYFNIINNVLKFAPGSSKIERVAKLKRFLDIGDSRQMILLNASNLFPEDFKELGIEGIALHQEYRETTLNEAEEAYPGQPLRQLMYLDQHTYLCSLMDRNDRSTMGAGIECREPFLDYRLVEGLATLPIDWFDKGKKGKYLLKKTMSTYLPKEILSHRKIGLSVPWTHYLSKEPVFADRLDEMTDCPVFESGILKNVNVKSLLIQFRKNPVQYGTIIGQLFMIFIWYETYCKRIMMPVELAVA